MFPIMWCYLSCNRSLTRAASHMVQGLWPYTCEGPWFSSKGHTTNMVCWNMCHANLLKVGLTQIMANYKTIIYSMPCRNPHRFFIRDDFFEHLDFHFLVWSELGQFQPFRPMRDLRMQWSQAFTLVRYPCVTYRRSTLHTLIK